MTFSFGSGHTVPVFVGNQDKGDICIQVRSGSGVWLGQNKTGIETGSPVDGALLDMRDGIFVTPENSPLVLPWAGDLWMYNPNASVETVFGSVFLMGCSG